MDRDRTGPQGEGPLTGRGRGFCIEFEIPKIEFPDFGREFDRGFRGFGRGFERGFRFHIQPKEFSKEEQIELLKKQKEAFEERALAIEEKLKQFEKPLKELRKPLKREKRKGGKR